MRNPPKPLSWLKARMYTLGVLAAGALVVVGFAVTPISTFYDLGWYLWIGVPGMVVFGILALAKEKHPSQRVVGGIGLVIGAAIALGILLLILVGIALLVYFFSLLGK